MASISITQKSALIFLNSQNGLPDSNDSDYTTDAASAFGAASAARISGAAHEDYQQLRIGLADSSGAFLHVFDESEIQTETLISPDHGWMDRIWRSTARDSSVCQSVDYTTAFVVWLSGKIHKVAILYAGKKYIWRHRFMDKILALYHVIQKLYVHLQAFK